MTEQEELQYLFDTSLNHIRKQGKPSIFGGPCEYRGPDGLQCAAGPFILEYHEDMEGTTFSELIDVEGYDADRFNAIAVKHREFVDTLQFAHDNPTKYYRDGYGLFMEKYEDSMYSIAKMHKLQYSNP